MMVPPYYNNKETGINIARTNGERPHWSIPYVYTYAYVNLQPDTYVAHIKIRCSISLKSYDSISNEKKLA
jgi:hypothetical protein